MLRLRVINSKNIQHMPHEADLLKFLTFVNNNVASERREV